MHIVVFCMDIRSLILIPAFYRGNEFFLNVYSGLEADLVAFKGPQRIKNSDKYGVEDAKSTLILKKLNELLIKSTNLDLKLF